MTNFQVKFLARLRLVWRMVVWVLLLRLLLFLLHIDLKLQQQTATTSTANNNMWVREEDFFCIQHNEQGNSLEAFFWPIFCEEVVEVCISVFIFYILHGWFFFWFSAKDCLNFMVFCWITFDSLSWIWFTQWFEGNFLLVDLRNVFQRCEYEGSCI